MARGIEELAEMQVTGPVQGGDMVMKPDQAPVGAAALLNKMSRQNTPGIFKLPMPDKEMPGFMKVAAEGVEQQTAKGDTINRMAGELLRQGIDIRGKGMDEIITIYEQVFGSPGDVDQFGVSENLFPGNFTNKEQDVTLLPRNLKTSEDAPETELAYITDDEKALLAFMKPGTPHEGPKGVPTYDEDPYDEQQVGQTYGSYQSSSQPDTPSESQQNMYAQMAATMGQAGIANVGGKELGTGQTSLTVGEDKFVFDKDDKGNVTTFKGDKGDSTKDVMQENLFSTFSPDTGFQGQPELSQKEMEKGDITDNWFEKIFQGDPLYQDTGEIPNYDEIVKLINEWEKADVNIKGIPNIMSILGALKGGPYKEGSDKLLREDGDLTLEGLKKKIKELGGDKAIESLKHLDPKLYYKFVSPQTSGSIEELAKLGAIQEGKGSGPKGTLTQMEKDLNRKIFEARETASKGQDRHPGGRTIKPAEEQIIEEDEVVTTTTDPKAGAFNVGGTMPYTHDVATGGVEMDVPLGRRFQIGKDKKYRGTTGGMDLNEAMQYATLGGYSQLEPFQEYLTRRRKHLGEDEPVYFDEEGNVIYSGVT